MRFALMIFIGLLRLGFSVSTAVFLSSYFVRPFAAIQSGGEVASQGVVTALGGNLLAGTVAMAALLFWPQLCDLLERYSGWVVPDWLRGLPEAFKSPSQKVEEAVRAVRAEKSELVRREVIAKKNADTLKGVAAEMAKKGGA